VSVAALSPQACRDLDSAVEWIARDNPVAAQGLLNAVLSAAERIGEHPQIGMRHPDLTTDPRYRFVVLTGYPYLIVYAADRNPPVIVRIVHGARDLPRVLRDL
jgi:toxin ParE1/3/4